MRVVMVIPSLGATGGLERVATTVALGIAPEVEQLTVCYGRPGPLLETLRDAQIKTIRIHRPKPRLDRLLRSSFGLARALRREHPDVVHAHNPAAGVAAVLARRLAGQPRAAVVASYHGVALGSDRYVVPALRLVDAVAVVSSGVSEQLAAAGVPRSKLTTVANAVAPQPLRDATAVRRELGIGDAPLVVSVGRYVREKDQRTLVEALARVRLSHPGVRAAIVGEGPLESQLHAQVVSLDLSEAVLLTGPRTDAVDVTAAADIFVLSSATEGLPLALLEALTLGRAVVATRVGGVPDVVDDGRTGLLVDPGDPVALAKAIERLLDDEALRRQLGNAGRELMAREHSVAAMVERTIALYDRLKSERRR